MQAPPPGLAAQLVDGPKKKHRKITSLDAPDESQGPSAHGQQSLARGSHSITVQVVTLSDVPHGGSPQLKFPLHEE